MSSLISGPKIRFFFLKKKLLNLDAQIDRIYVGAAKKLFFI